MATLLGIDTGGTYTDAVLLDDERGVVGKAKALTTKYDLSVGIHNAVDAILSIPPSDIMAVSLSSTLATNAVVEGQGSPICLILIGYEPIDLKGIDFEKIMRNGAIVFIAGGHNTIGEEQAPLDLDAAREAILAHSQKVAAFAVSGFFSVRNPKHELQVRQLIRELTDLPVTCGHELTSNLNAPRRALTAALNARLIPLLQQLILAVRDTLDRKDIHAPLMIVKGDGSLISAQMALERPVETIMSGPAASVIGARYLTDTDDVFVIDMGGTTTDIASLRNGQPFLNLNGARVGGWQTMVEAIDVRTVGLGGDSEVWQNEDGGLNIGPRRVVPLSQIAEQNKDILALLRNQTREHVNRDSGYFIMRQRSLGIEQAGMTSSQKEIWKFLDNGPVSLSDVLNKVKYPKLYRDSVQELVELGLVVLSAFTPTDAVHVLGKYQSGSKEAAELGAALWSNRLGVGIEEFCEMVVQQTVAELGLAVLNSALVEEGKLAISKKDNIGRLLIDRALTSDVKGNFSLSLYLRKHLIAIGAPVETYLPFVASQLHADLCIPEHAEVANAIGAVASEIVQSVKVLIRPVLGRESYRVYLPFEMRDFQDLEGAIACANEVSRQYSLDQAHRAGAKLVDVHIERHDSILHASEDWPNDVYLETEIIATAVGRIPLGV